MSKRTCSKCGAALPGAEGLAPADIQRRRRALCITQVQLAARLGVAGNTVARWEQGRIRVPPYVDLALRTIEGGCGASVTTQ